MINEDHLKILTSISKKDLDQSRESTQSKIDKELQEQIQLIQSYYSTQNYSNDINLEVERKNKERKAAVFKHFGTRNLAHGIGNLNPL